MARKIIEFIDCWQVYNKSLLRKTFVQANSSSLSYLLIALNQIWGSNFKSLNVSRSHSKHFEVSVSQSKKSKCLGLAKKNASLAVSQSLAFTIRHPCFWFCREVFCSCRDVFGFAVTFLVLPWQLWATIENERVIHFSSIFKIKRN